MTKTKLFIGHHTGGKGYERRFVDIDEEMNNFLADESVEFVDVKLTSFTQGEKIRSTALLIYKER